MFLLWMFSHLPNDPHPPPPSSHIKEKWQEMVDEPLPHHSDDFTFVLLCWRTDDCCDRPRPRLKLTLTSNMVDHLPECQSEVADWRLEPERRRLWLLNMEPPVQNNLLYFCQMETRFCSRQTFVVRLKSETRRQFAEDQNFIYFICFQTDEDMVRLLTSDF